MKHRLSPKALARLPECTLDAEEGSCGLVELGQLGGVEWLWFFDQRRGAAPFGELIERRADGSLRRVWGLSVMSVFPITARLIEREEGDFLHVPVRYAGTGAFREDRLFHWRQDHWRELDAASWLQDLELPTCYGIWKGPRIDFDKLTFVSGVWIEGDGNCCPSGGEIRVRLEVGESRLFVADQQHDLSSATGSVDDPHRRIDPARCQTRRER